MWIVYFLWQSHLGHGFTIDHVFWLYSRSHQGQWSFEVNLKNWLWMFYKIWFHLNSISLIAIELPSLVQYRYCSRLFNCTSRGGLGSQTGRGKNIKAALLIYMAAQRVKRAECVTDGVQGPTLGPVEFCFYAILENADLVTIFWSKNHRII